MKAQSEIIENLSHQVTSVTKGTGNEVKFKQIFKKIANQSSLIQSITKKLNQTIKHVDELAGVWSETTVTVRKDLKSLAKDNKENEEEIEEMEHEVMARIKKLEDEINTLRVSVNYAKERSEGSREGELIRNSFFFQIKIISRASRIMILWNLPFLVRTSHVEHYAGAFRRPSVIPSSKTIRLHQDKRILVGDL